MAHEWKKFENKETGDVCYVCMRCKSIIESKRLEDNLEIIDKNINKLNKSIQIMNKKTNEILNG